MHVYRVVPILRFELQCLRACLVFGWYGFASVYCLVVTLHCLPAAQLHHFPSKGVEHPWTIRAWRLWDSTPVPAASARLDVLAANFIFSLCLQVQFRGRLRIRR